MNGVAKQPSNHKKQLSNRLQTIFKQKNPMIFSIAWRNIWRQKARSLVVMAAVALGIWATNFLMSFSFGMIVSYINNGIENQYSHIQIHHPDFKEDFKADFTLKGASDLLQSIQANEEVKTATGRVIANGMVNSAKGARGLQIIGVQPENEAAVTKLNEKIVDGAYFEGAKRNPMLISKGVAEKLGLKIRSKVVLTFQDIEGEIVNAAFRVVGIFDSKTTMVDDSRLFVRQSDLERLMNMEDAVHEIAIYLNDPNTLDQTTQSLTASVGNEQRKIETWREIAPELELIHSQFEVSMYVVMAIILLALAFGIINTMLMAVLERTRELGMLMAVGMSKFRVYGMIVLETILLTFIGAPIGLLLGYLSIGYFSNHGLDLSAYSDGLQEFGMSTIVYPSLDAHYYMIMTVMIAVTAILAALYPAYKAIKLKPVEALRAI